MATLPRDPMTDPARREYPRSRSLVRAVRGLLARVLLSVAAVASCALATSCDAPACVVGDRIGCRCNDGTYGYMTCQASGHFPDGGCDCINGLTPDASTAE